VSEARVEPFATWERAQKWIAGRAYALIAAWCSYLIAAADTLLSDASTGEKARRLLAVRTIISDFLREVGRAADLDELFDRLRSIYERESVLAAALEREARGAAKFPKRAVELEELAARTRFRARCAFLFAGALERFLELERAVELGIDAPHLDWDEEGVKARLLLPLRAWRLGAARLLLLQAIAELRGGPARLHQLLELLAGDLAPFASFERRRPPPPADPPFAELFERMDRIERILEDLLKRMKPELDPVGWALHSSLAPLNCLDPSTFAGRFAAEKAAKALEALRELQFRARLRQVVRETYLELARLNARRVELGLEPKPLPPPPEEECGWCPDCPFRSWCPEARLIYGGREEEERRKSYGEEEW
jgi:hypothetical protein